MEGSCRSCCSPCSLAIPLNLRRSDARSPIPHIPHPRTRHPYFPECGYHSTYLFILLLLPLPSSSPDHLQQQCVPRQHSAAAGRVCGAPAAGHCGACGVAVGSCWCREGGWRVAARPTYHGGGDEGRRWGRRMREDGGHREAGWRCVLWRSSAVSPHTHCPAPRPLPSTHCSPALILL